MPSPAPTRQAQQPARARGIPLGSVWGIELRLAPSVLIVFALIVGSLAWGTLPTWHPDWSAPLVGTVALGAGVLFLASVLLHELAHSVVAQSRGVPVPRITLFLFGGLSEMESEPEDPGTELAIAIVGPLTSLAIGGICLVIASVLLPDGFREQATEDPQGAMSSLGAVATLLLWLGPINVLLGLFNLVPGFPLDGGRVLRAVLWSATGDRMRATALASTGGQIVAFGLMAWGVVTLLSGGLDGLWLIFIGWFLNNAARSSHARLLLEDTLKDLRVGDLMRTPIRTIRADTEVRRFLDDVAAHSDQGMWPVVDDEGTMIGTLSVAHLHRLDDDALRGPVGDLAEPIDEVLAPSEGGAGALRTLAEHDNEPLLVVEDGTPVGLLRPTDIARWMALTELRGGDAQAPSGR